MTDSNGPDYTLNVFHDIDPETNDPCISFVVQTTKVFVSFRYDILLEVSVEKRAITVAIKGLHAPELLMPGSGPAYGLARMKGASGHYELNVIKQDKTVHTFDIDIGEKDVTILRNLPASFVVLSTDAVAPS